MLKTASMQTEKIILLTLYCPTMHLHKGNGGAAVHSWKIFKLMLIGGETAQGTPQKTITGKPF